MTGLRMADPPTSPASGSPQHPETGPLAGELRLRFVDPLAEEEWDRLVEEFPGRHVFHGSAWARVLSRTYGHRPFYTVGTRDGRPVMLLPLMEVRSFVTGRRGVSVPFADLCEPLTRGGGPGEAFVPLLLDLARERRWKHLEWKGGGPPVPSAFSSVSFLAHTLDLRTSLEGLRENLEPSFRRNLRKAENSGLTVESRQDQAAMAAYYQLHTLTRRRHGLPPQSWRFFLNLWEEIIRTGLGFIVVASLGKEPVAGAVFLHAGDQAIYKFGASDERFFERRPNHLVMWTGICSSRSRGATSLHFGRTSRGHEGLRRFKLGWGAAETTLEYFKYSFKTGTWARGNDRVSGSHTALFSRFPLALNRLAGRLIYPHLD